jgi:hypothetical protein
MSHILTSSNANHNKPRSGGGPTNRGSQTADSAVEMGPDVGVDTIRLRGQGFNLGLTHWTERCVVSPITGEASALGSTWYGSVQVEGHPVGLHVDERRDIVTFEVSVPRLIRASNEVAATAAETLKVAQHIYERTTRVVDWHTAWQDLDVSRLDLVRTFENVYDLDTTLRRLSHVPQRAGRVRKVFNDPRLGRALTYSVGTPKRWMATAYDKPAEMLAAAARTEDGRLAMHLRSSAHDLRSRGHLRTEMSVRRKPLQERLRTTRLQDLVQEDVMNRTAEHFFRSASFDAPVGGSQKVRRAVDAMAAHPEDKRRTGAVVAMLWMEAHGIPPTCSPRSRDDYRVIARRYDLSAADFVVADSQEMRLDWASGSLVERAA